MKEKSIEIELIIIGKPQWEGGWPYIGYDNNELISAITTHIVSSFPNVNFRPNELISTYDKKLVLGIEHKLSDADAMLVFTIGHYGDPGLIKAGKEIINSTQIPCILANIIYGGDHTFIKLYSAIKDKPNRVYPISSQKYEDFDDYITILIKILQMREEKILLLAPESRDMSWDKVLDLIKPERKRIAENQEGFIEQMGVMRRENFEFFTDLEGADQAHPWRVNLDEYRTLMAEIFGVELVRGDPEMIAHYYDKVNKEEATKIAKKWMREAEKVDPTERSIINSAKIYLAIKQLLTNREEKYKIFTPDCGTLLLLGKMPAYPCMAFFELSKENIYGICESDTNSAISFLLGLYLTGRPGYVSNHTLDLVNEQVTYMHCVAPCNLYGRGSKRLDYEIVYHGESNFLGAVPRVKFPKNEVVTTIKVSIAKRKIAFRQGIILENIDEPGGCVGKILVKDDATRILENYDWDTFGWHRVTFLGDWKKEFKVAARLLGLEWVVENQ
ncbi:MAG: hypothetical protein GF364_10390 [Candidatus Lokiarchaeota archaeon]|nr:hypothetical protein [Candidatus Lokiarchaeota archaeon]